MRKSKEHFRHEWKYLINRAEKQLTDLRLRECMQLDPHAGGRRLHDSQPVF